MRKLIFIFTLLPSFVFGQLDRLKGDMTEAEFQKQIPEAKRDYEADSGWLELTDSVNGVKGRSTWRIYDDTVVAYRFLSRKTDGPSDKYPKFDSADVHKLRASADVLRRKLELSLGKPNKVYNVSFIAPNPMDNSIFYLAEWKFSENEIVRITVMKELVINDKPKLPSSGQTSQIYQLALNIDHADLYTRMNYSVGKSATEFFVRYPQLKEKANFLAIHTYAIRDSVLSNKAGWKFWFYEGEFGRMEYFAFVGKPHGTKSVAVMYPAIVERVNDLLAQGNKGFGVPDSLVSSMPGTYPVREQNANGKAEYVYARWHGKQEKVVFTCYENYIGKADGYITISVHFDFVK